MTGQNADHGHINIYQQVDSAGHAFVPVLVTLNDAAVIQQSLQQPRDRADECRPTFLPSWIF